MGRPAEFDEGQVLVRAMATFRKSGYEGTSLEDLLRETGIARQSLYNRFGDKRSLFLRCLQHYHEQQLVALRGLFASVRPVTAAFAKLFGGVVEGDDALKRQGCLAINTAMELARKDVEIADFVAANQRQMEDVFADALTDGQSRGELGPSVDPRKSARFLVGSFFGLIVIAKSDPRSPALADLAAMAVGCLER